MSFNILDLCSGAGGAARGYQQAGFDVTGVDIVLQPRYAGDRFVQHDALGFLRGLLDGYAYKGLTLASFASIHASWPCQAHCDLQKQNKRTYPDLIPEGRELLKATGLPYVIENVEGAPLEDPVMLCGAMFPELRVYRHRLFETSWPMTVPAHPKHSELVFTHDKRKAHYGRPLDLKTMRVQVTGGGNAPVWAKAQAMDIDWMTGKELNEAIPPAYTRFVGAQLVQHLVAARAAA